MNVFNLHVFTFKRNKSKQLIYQTMKMHISEIRYKIFIFNILDVQR
jgi:hypothetical protein